MLFRDARIPIGRWQNLAGSRRAVRLCCVLIETAKELEKSREDEDLLFLLKQSASDQDLRSGRFLHFLLVHYRLDEYLSWCNRLLGMYARCGATLDAHALFNSMDERDPHSWRFIMRANASDNQTCMQFFQQMINEGSFPEKVTFISVLSACFKAENVADGMRIHACIECTEFVRDMEVANTIINMYGNCGYSVLAAAFYDGMVTKNVITFNTMIGCFIQVDKHEEALILFKQLELQAVTPSNVTFISIVSACTAVTNLAKGKEMHARVEGSELVSDIILMNAFLNMYGACGYFMDTKKLFCKMPRQDVATWNCLISSLVQHNQKGDAFQALNHMYLMGHYPNNITILNTLAACEGQEHLEKVKQLHLQVQSGKSEPDIVLGTALVNAYGECNDLENAVKIFRNTPYRDVILWNAMIKAYLKSGQQRVAIELFKSMQKEGIIPSKVTVIVILDAFNILEEGKKMHEFVVKHGHAIDPVIGTGLINMYVRCGSINDVLKVFDSMPCHDVVSWNALLAATVQHASKDLFCMFQMMLVEGILPDNITFTSMFSGCKGFVKSKVALWIHTLFISSALRCNVHDTNCIIDMYGQCGYVNLARRTFEESEYRDQISWNVLIAAYSQSKQSKEALFIVRQMQTEGLSQGSYTLINLISGFCDSIAVLEGKRVYATIIGSSMEGDIGITNSLLNMFVRSGALNDARIFFDMVINKDIITWNTLLASCLQSKNEEEAMFVFYRMFLECMLPDEVTCTYIVSSCANNALMDEGKRIHVCILESTFTGNITLMNALITMYGKSGSLDDALKVFDKMNVCNVVSWSAIIAAHALHGQGEAALNLYNRMQEDSLAPNKITYLIVLCACSHAGLLKEGLECFMSMIQVCGLKPTQKHINSVVDLLGRAGLLDAAEILMDTQSTSFSWTTLLSVCRMHYDKIRGERAAKHALLLEPDNSSLYVLLSNLYALQQI
ncbi:hypothetical protein KP509_37G010300 [Ceratopteris richardii]|uniref:Pentatricopeptide repeat-containing protein n=1 Tax=Ceratopteris richardii TaxID=49495 RepID=A0A8T2Q6F5_CERRI|nr:hypothetical protein KP509_37G010300 [Ceratopteris richardii]